MEQADEDVGLLSEVFDKIMSHLNVMSSTKTITNGNGSREQYTQITAREIISQMPEILEQIFSHLDIKSLCRVATVCKLWNQVAMSELRKQSPQLIVIPVSKIYNFFTDTMPLITIFFVNRNLWQLSDIMNYPNYFPNHPLIVAKENVMLDEKEMGDSTFQTKRGIAWSLMPHYRDLKIRAVFDKHLLQKTWSVQYFTESDSIINAFLNDVLPEDSQSQTTFILFNATVFDDVRIPVVLHKRMQERQQECVIWGADVFLGPLSRLECSEILDHRGVFAMSITGSRLKSAATVINCKLKKREFDQRLLDFRRRVEDQIQSSRRSIGFLCGPKLRYENPVDHYVKLYKNYTSDTYWEHKGITKTVKKVFPDVTIVGIYDHLRCYGLMSKADDPEQKVEHEHSVALMILSFH